MKKYLIVFGIILTSVTYAQILNLVDNLSGNDSN